MTTKNTDTTSPDAELLEGPGEGFIVLTDTLCQGLVPAWSTTNEQGEEVPLVYKTERAAFLEIIDEIEEHIRQFKMGERDFHSINFGEEESVAAVTVAENGDMTFEDGTVLTLAQWREQR